MGIHDEVPLRRGGGNKEFPRFDCGAMKESCGCGGQRRSSASPTSFEPLTGHNPQQDLVETSRL
eukprot:11179197-Prorocentrum_lima.AAC.1